METGKSVLTAQLETMVHVFNEASGTDIKTHTNRMDGDYVFTLKDERTLNRVAYVKVPTMEAFEWGASLELFARKMWELIEEANVVCDHSNVRFEYESPASPNDVPTILCEDCETEMIEEEPGSYAVRTSY